MSVIKSTSYSIVIGNKSFHALNTFLSNTAYTKFIIICDEHTMEACLSTLLFHCEKLQQAEIIELESGEGKKNIETCMQVWGALTDIGADKKSLIINLGGGVITDLGGFVASTYKRGIDFINIPTTLLSMVDASVGGKNGIDFESIKNHIGTIQHPQQIFINPDFLSTLPIRHIRNGYAEIIKIALIADKQLWQQLRLLKNNYEFQSENIITSAIKLKNQIVKKDLHEKNLRKSLNFGHSIGHALESALLEQKKDILHGEAIATGMLIESIVAHHLKYISTKEKNDIQAYIFQLFKPIKINNKTKLRMMHYLIHDKKNEGGHLCFSLPKGIGQFSLHKGITTTLVERAITEYSQLISN